MKICSVGLSHKTAPVELREKIAFSTPQKLEEALLFFKKEPAIKECLILSTCNRVEIYLVADRESNWKDLIVNKISLYQGIDKEEFINHLYFKEGKDAIKHIFRVAAGLDSMVLGEPQILGQLKEAYGFASGKNATGFVMNKLMHTTFSVAKRIRTETKIGSYAVSISYVAVELAKKIFEKLDGRKAMLIGAGEMAELAAKHLLANGISQIIVANRTYERACALAEEFNGIPCRFDEFPERLKDVDIVISSTGAPGFVITPDKVRSAIKLRRNNPMFFIDIAVPRDIDPKVNELDNVFVYDIDDLQNVVDSNLAERKKEAEKAELIIDEELENFLGWVRSLQVKPLLVTLRKEVEKIKEEELTELKRRLSTLSDKEFKVIEAFANAMMNKFLHHPTVFLKEISSSEDSYLYLEVFRRIFQIKVEGDGDEKGI